MLLWLIFCTPGDNHTKHYLQACVYRPKCAIRTSYLCEMRSCTITSPRRRSTSCAMLPWLLQGDTTQVGTKMPCACFSTCFLACWLCSPACAVCPSYVHVGFNMPPWHHQVWLQSCIEQCTSQSLHECRYSHVLKTDDDCYVRVAKLVHLVQKLERDGQGMLYIGRQVIDVNCDIFKHHL